MSKKKLVETMQYIHSISTSLQNNKRGEMANAAVDREKAAALTWDFEVLKRLEKVTVYDIISYLK